MAANDYHFQEGWDIAGYTPSQVYEVLYDASILPRWWSGVYLEAVPLGRCTRPEVGARARVRARGLLPYTLGFVLEAIELSYGRRVVVRATGDFDGIWRAELRRHGDGTRVEIEWTVTVHKPIVRWLSPLLRPLFAWNHRWTTVMGEAGLRRYLDARHRSSSPALPEPCVA